MKSGPTGYLEYLMRGVEFGNRLIDYVADSRDVNREEAIGIITNPARTALTQRVRPMTKVVDDYAFRLPKYIQRTVFADRK